MKMKLRVLHNGYGYYFPQYKFLFWWMYFEKIIGISKGTGGAITKLISFSDKVRAIEFCKKQEKKKENIRSEEVVWSMTT